MKQPDYKYEEDVSSTSWTDKLGRLRVWASNIGADQTGQSSLEFRLRDASHISQQMTKLLKNLDGILSDVKDKISSDPVEASEVTTLPDDEESWPGDDPPSELQQLYEEVVNIVNCLYKMSILIRRPAQHDLLICHYLSWLFYHDSCFCHWSIGEGTPRNFPGAMSTSHSQCSRLSF